MYLPIIIDVYIVDRQEIVKKSKLDVKYVKQISSDPEEPHSPP
jgi:hypothetical protein